MAASRLSDSQKQQLVQRYRQGESSTELASAFGCSANTVSRTVKAALDPADYEQLKQQRGRSVAVVASGPANQADDPAPEQRPVPEQIPAPEQASVPAAVANLPLEAAVPAEAAGSDDLEESPLAIDDADDFGDDDVDVEVDDGDLDSDDDAFRPIAVLPLEVNQEPVQVRPLEAAVLPESLYMLVDKTVELQPKPLRDFSDLGLIPAEQEERQALQLFANPRQAKRHCGRTQRVIKMPDPEVLVRQASYLQVKGISHLVVEGALYALPGF